MRPISVSPPDGGLFQEEYPPWEPTLGIRRRQLSILYRPVKVASLP
jgi:hypothetical protein